MPKPTITSVTPLSEQDVPPVILEFENATPSEEEDHAVTYKTDPKTKIRTMTVEYKGETNTTYSGTIGDGYPTDLMSTWIGIYNKRTNTVRFVEAEQCRLKSSHYYEKEQQGTTRAIDTRSLLYKSFGSKSAARAIDRKEKTAYNEDIIKTQINDSLMDASAMDDSQVGEEISDIAPPCNKDASKVKDAYTLEDILPKEILHALESNALSLIEIKPIHLP